MMTQLCWSFRQVHMMASQQNPKLRFAAIAANLAPARNAVRHYMARNGWQDMEMDVSIALGEVLQNIVRHGFTAHDKSGHFVLYLKATDLRLYIEVVDNALPSDPATWTSAGKPLHEGGHGLRLIKSIAHKVDFIPLKTGNKVCLYFWKR
ncbi:ATP-binding protein [Candidatus Puniceispirillum marinum]|nr:ATP-binding protein [Candidatus Puniceispirillum marinum]